MPCTASSLGISCAWGCAEVQRLWWLELAGCSHTRYSSAGRALRAYRIAAQVWEVFVSPSSHTLRFMWQGTSSSLRYEQGGVERMSVADFEAICSV
eukprot:6486680-Amphidinium_carterae.1